MRVVELLILAVSSGTAMAQSTSGIISGVVLNNAGQPLPGVTVSCGKLSTFIRDKDGHRVLKDPGFDRTVVAGAAGTFVFSGLPAGHYGVCAQAQRSSQLGDCECDAVPVVALKDGESIQGLKRTVHEAATVSIRVIDVNLIIEFPDAQGKLRGERRFFPGLATLSGYYQPAKLISSARGEHVFAAKIPKLLPVRLFLDTELTVADFAGRLLEKRQPTTLEISAGDRDSVTIDLVIK